MKNAESYSRKNVFIVTGYLSWILFFSFSGFGQDSIINSRLQIHGYLKNMPSVFFVDNTSSMVTGNFVHNRINLKWDISEGLFFRAEARNRLYYGEQVKQTYQFGKYIDTDAGLIDMSHNIVDDTSIVINTTLDRVLLSWSNENWDITAGRQRINWGINLVWNPNDIFNAFNYFDFDYEERPGSDAIRIQYTTNKLSSLELAYKFSEKEKEQVGAVMYRTNFKEYDWQSFAGIYFEDIVIGSGWAGNIKNAGFKGEVSYFHPYKEITDTSGVLSASISFDRSFKNDYFAMISYLYNSEGKRLLYGINDLTGVTLSAKRLMPFQHSFFAQVSKSFTPLVNGNIAFIFSSQDKTLILLPSLAVSLSNNWDLALVGQSFFYDIDGVYRTFGNGVYFRLRWSY